MKHCGIWMRFLFAAMALLLLLGMGQPTRREYREYSEPSPSAAPSRRVWKNGQGNFVVLRQTDGSFFILSQSQSASPD